MHASVNGTRVFFDVDGARAVWDGDKEVDKPVILMLPGGPGSSHMHYKRPGAGFDSLRSMFQMVYVDWRGGGRSDRLPPEQITLDGAVADVEAIREMLGIETWAVLGASGGGIWAIAYAGAHPERVTHLVVLHSAGRVDYFGDQAESMARRAGVTDEEAISIYRGFTGGELTTPVDGWAMQLRDVIVTVQNALYSDPNKQPEVAERRTKVWNEAPPEELMRELDVARWYLRDMKTSYSLSRVADKITCPTLVMTGEADPVAPPSQSIEIHEALPHSELFIHPGGHMPHGEDEQEIFFGAIRSFFEKHGVREIP